MRNILFLPLVILPLFCSCESMRGTRYRNLPSNPFYDIKRIAVMPVQNNSDQQIDTRVFTELLAAEILKFPGFDVVTPGSYPNESGTIHTVADLTQFGAGIDADAIMVVTINSFDSYPPPRMAVRTEVFRLKGAFRRSKVEIDKLTSAQSWKEAGRPDEFAKYAVGIYELSLDSRFELVKKEVEEYSYANSGKNSAFIDVSREYLYIKENFWKFVCSQIVMKLVQEGNRIPPDEYPKGN